MAGKNVVVPDEEPREPREFGGPGNLDQGWTQTEKAAHSAMWKMGVKYPSALAVLHFMISKLNRGAGGIIISAPALARAMGISERTAKGAVAVLRDMQFVQILKSGNTNVYIINSKVAWTGRRGARYASFNAQLIIDEQEQVKELDEIIKESEELHEVPVIEMHEDSELPDPEKGTIEGQFQEVKGPKQRDLLTDA